MPVQRVVVTSVEARRFTRPDEPLRGQVRVDHNSSVTSVRPAAGTDEKATEMEFRFTASYGPVGMVKLEGLIRGSWEMPAKELAEAWQNKRDMPRDVAQQVHASVMTHCVPISVVMSREVQLPPPIPIPMVNIPDKAHKAQAGAPGPEIM